MNLRRVLSVFAICGLPLFTPACVRKPNNSHTLGNVSRGDDRWTNMTIPVCFEQDGFDVDKRNVRDTITGEYADLDDSPYVTFGFTFTGWDRCVPNAPGLHVRFQPESASSRVQTFGNTLDGKTDGILLGLSHACKSIYSGSECQKNVTTHEFGHALGLHHEMNRRDNPVCGFEQTDGLGEDDAVQIGDFDEASVMNYCHIFKANDENRFVHLSAGDRATLLNRYRGVQATFADAPPPRKITDLNQLAAKITGANVTQYKIKVGLFREIKCENEADYAGPYSVGAAINPSELEQKFQLPLGNNLRLCLLGGNANNQWQDSKLYTSLDFYRHDPNDVKGPELQSLEILADATSPSGRSLKILVKDASEVDNVFVYFSYAQYPLLGKSASQNLRSSVRPKGEIVVQIPDTLANGPVHLQSLTFRDIAGNSSAYSADAERKFFVSTTIPVPTYTITDRRDPEMDKPVVKVLRVLRAEAANNAPARLEIGVEDASAIEHFRITATLKQSPSRFVPYYFYPSQLTKNAAGNYEVELSNSLLDIGGEYWISALEFTDTFYNNTLLSAAEDAATYKDTNFPVLRIQGLDKPALAVGSPKLLGIGVTHETLHQKQFLNVPFTVSSGNGLRNISAHFERVGAQPGEPELTTDESDVDMGVAGQAVVNLQYYGSMHMPLGQYILKTLIMENLEGVVVTMRADGEQKFLEGTTIPLPIIDLLSPEPLKPDVPTILRIPTLQPSYSKATGITFTLDIAAKASLKFVVVSFFKDGNILDDTAQVSGFVQDAAPGTVTFKIDMIEAPNGNYSMTAIYLEDIDGRKTVYEALPGATTFHDSTLPVQQFQLLD